MSRHTIERLATIMVVVLGACGSPARVDVCARGDRDVIATALAGGRLELTFLDDGNQVLAHAETSPNDATHLGFDLPAQATVVQVEGFSAADVLVANGRAAVSDRTCVCLALDDQTRAACDGITCAVIDDQCFFYAGDQPADARTLRFGDNPDDDIAGVTADTYLSSATDELGDNFGGSIRIVADDASPVTGLLRFDLRALPRSSDIVRAELLLVTQTIPGADADKPVRFHRVLESWDEGVYDGAAGVANWQDRALGTAWSSPGCGIGSREATDVGFITPAALGTAYTLDVTASVKAWTSDPDSNFGFALVSDVMGTGAYFVSHEAPVANGTRPQLAVTFRLP